MTSENLSVSEIMEQQFKNVHDELSDLSKRTRDVQDNFKLLQKTWKNAEKTAKTKKKKVQSKHTLSPGLEKFLKVSHGTQMTKADVMKAVSEYIKTNNLQLEDNKRKFMPNSKLAKIFSMNTKEPLTFVEINKHVSVHLTKCS